MKHKVALQAQSQTGRFSVGDIICSGLHPGYWYRVEYIIGDSDISQLTISLVYHIIKQFDVVNKNPVLWFIGRML